MTTELNDNKIQPNKQQNGTLHHKKSWSSNRLWSIIRIIWVTVSNVCCIPTYVLWLLTLYPFRFIYPDFYWWFEGVGFEWLLAMVSCWSWSAGYTLVLSGDDVEKCLNQECLVIVNHQSTADVPLLFAFCQKKAGMCSRIMWLMDYLFLYTNFGLVSKMHGDYFIKAGKEQREIEKINLRNHLLRVFCPRRRKWLFLFPEGGFLRKRKAGSKRFAERNNLPNLEHVTLPRVGAMHAIINTLHPSKLESTEGDKKIEPLKWVVDITVGYPGGNPLDLPTLIAQLKEPTPTHLYFRRYPIEEVPTEEEELLQWLYARFIEKEYLLQTFYKMGEFPESGKGIIKPMLKPEVVDYPPSYFILLHIVFFLSCTFHIYLISYLTSICF